MSSERWQQVVDLFDEVLDLPANEREQQLDVHCGEDKDLRQSVVALLLAEQEADEFMEKPLVSAPNDLHELAQGGLPGAMAPDGGRLGPYRLLRQIGEGGMSTVYLAVREDDFRRRVAIKIIRHGTASDDAQRRLRTERQILASLHHPLLAELYDGGMTAAGLPYFAMEYIDGRPIDEYCDHHQLTVEERVALFRKVCEAVHYAHQNLVVHRDLKPSNILVTTDGTPKLLDFGIAKLLNPELVAPELEPTATWLRMMTPHYASPEQVRGEMITTASDVYSLGILLYKLLTGRVPRDFTGKTPREIERELTDTEPAKPSTVVSQMNAADGETKPATETSPDTRSMAWNVRPEQHRRELRGDLDMIVMKTLRHAPQRRYGSVEQLSLDLNRHLRGFPVHARQGNVRYRLGKFLRRNWIPASVTSFIVLLVFAFALAMAMQSAITARERDQARQERDEKDQVLALMQDVFKLADPTEAKGKSFTVHEALNRSAANIGRRLSGQPLVEAALRHSIGTIYLHLGLHDEARPHLTKSLDLRRRQQGETSPDVARSLASVGAVLREQGEYDVAHAYAEEAVAMTRRLFGEDAPHLVEPLNHLSVLLCYQDEYEQAEGPSHEALTLAERHLDSTHSDLADAVSNRAVVLRHRGELAGAEKMYRKALDLHRMISGKHHPVVADILNNLAVVLRVQGEYRKSARFHRETLTLRRKLYGENHLWVGQSLANLASVLRDDGDKAGAENAFTEALVILEPTLGQAHPMTIKVSAALGSLLNDRGRAEAAETLLRGNLPVWREKLGAQNEDVALAESTLGEAVAAQGRFTDAETLLTRSLMILEEHYGKEHQRARQAAARLAVLREAQARSGKTSLP